MLSIKTFAPGKVILSGEHSVVYGSPALAIAINQQSTVLLQSNDQGGLILNLPMIQHTAVQSRKQLASFHHKLDTRFALHIKEPLEHTHPLLTSPTDLYFYAIAEFLERHHLQHDNIIITLNSDIPLGSGMGSSASSLAALYLGLHRYFKIPVDKCNLIHHIAHAERLQHLAISRIDPNVVIHGGLIRFYNNKINHLNASLVNNHWHLIHTGTPKTSTGECVSHVRNAMGKSRLWDEFKSITLDLQHALECHKYSNISHCIIANHQLLVNINVVPNKVKIFIKTLHSQHNIAAKISGAGSIKGNSAGLVLAYLPDNATSSLKALKSLCKQYNYSTFPLTVNTKGVHCYD